MTFTAANASLKPGWKIVREGRRFALLWQSQQAKQGWNGKTAAAALPCGVTPSLDRGNWLSRVSSGGRRFGGLKNLLAGTQPGHQIDREMLSA